MGFVAVSAEPVAVSADSVAVSAGPVAVSAAPAVGSATLAVAFGQAIWSSLVPSALSYAPAWAIDPLG